jgi:hypothetical protein
VKRSGQAGSAAITLIGRRLAALEQSAIRDPGADLQERIAVRELARKRQRAVVLATFRAAASSLTPGPTRASLRSRAPGQLPSRVWSSGSNRLTWPFASP